MFDHGAIPALLQQDVVRRLGPMLIDDNRGIQEGAAGTLRYSWKLEGQMISHRINSFLELLVF